MSTRVEPNLKSRGRIDHGQLRLWGTPCHRHPCLHLSQLNNTSQHGNEVNGKKLPES